MQYLTLITKENSGVLTVTINRLSHRNSINSELLQELDCVLDEAENDDLCKVIIIEGQNGVFCTGMDFEEVMSIDHNDSELIRDKFCTKYINLLRRISTISKIVIANIDGQVIAGGVGIAIASDIVVATPRTQISLSEALWGLLPSMVLPYLIRRIGYQRAYKMTLTTLPISAQEALNINLVDEVSENPYSYINRLNQRLMKIESSTVGNMKNYFRKLWIINDEMEEAAVQETSKLIMDNKVQQNIINFVLYKRFPWDNE